MIFKLLDLHFSTFKDVNLITSHCKHTICFAVRSVTFTASTRKLLNKWNYHSFQIFFLFIGRELTTWPANKSLQMMVCSCALLAANNILLMRKRNHAFLLVAIALKWKWQIASLPKLGDRMIKRLLNSIITGRSRIMNHTYKRIMNHDSFVLKTWESWIFALRLGNHE